MKDPIDKLAPEDLEVVVRYIVDTIRTHSLVERQYFDALAGTVKSLSDEINDLKGRIRVLEYAIGERDGK